MDKSYLDNVRQLTENNPYVVFRNDYHRVNFFEQDIISIPADSFITQADRIIKNSRGFKAKRPVKTR